MAPKFALFTKGSKLPLNKGFKNMFTTVLCSALNYLGLDKVLFFVSKILIFFLFFPAIHRETKVYKLGQFVCVEVLPPSQHNGIMSSVVSLPNYTFTGQAYSLSS